MTLVLCTTCSNETESGYPCSWCADKADCLDLCKLYAVDPETIDLTQLTALPVGQRGDWLYRVRMEGE